MTGRVPTEPGSREPSPSVSALTGFDPSRDGQLANQLRAEAESHLVMDVARHVSERVHEVMKLHAMTMPTVSAAIGLGLVVAQQIYAETVQFAANSMEGDAADEEAIRDAAGVLMRELLDVIDIPEITDWSNAERGKFYRDRDRSGEADKTGTGLAEGESPDRETASPHTSPPSSPQAG